MTSPGPAPILDLGVNRSTDSATYRRRHHQRRRLEKQGIVTCREKADAEILVSQFPDVGVTEYRETGGKQRWRVTMAINREIQ